jgi:hypothetical protein
MSFLDIWYNYNFYFTKCFVNFVLIIRDLVATINEMKVSCENEY